VTYMIRLPWPPSVNTYWRNANGRTYVSRRGKEFRAEATEAIHRQLGKPPTLDERLSVHIELSPPCRRKRDIDNHAKGVPDALTQAGLIADDELVDLLVISRLPKDEAGAGCADVTVMTNALNAVDNRE